MKFDSWNGFPPSPSPLGNERLKTRIPLKSSSLDRHRLDPVYLIICEERPIARTKGKIRRENQALTPRIRDFFLFLPYRIYKHSPWLHFFHRQPVCCHYRGCPF